MNERILIVEDEPQMLRLLGMTLQKEGYQITAAQSAAAAKADRPASILPRITTSSPVALSTLTSCPSSASPSALAS